MRKMVFLSGTLVLGAIACSPDGPTQPESIEGRPNLAAMASGSWSSKAAYPGVGLFNAFAAMAPNSAGQSIVYLMGGTDGEGGTSFGVKAYNVATNTWSFKTARVGVFGSNGAAKLGSRIYFSGGYNAVETPPSFTNAVWAYDYAKDQMIRKADLPILSAEGVSGVISGKLYVLPGACSGDRYPNPGYCAEEPTRRFFRYDPAANAWVTLASAPHFHRGGAAGVINGKLYVAGGANGFDPVADLDVYDPASNSWRSLAPVPTSGAAIGAVIQGKLFVITTGGGGLRSYAYNPNTNAWQAKAAPAASHDGLVRVTFNGSTRLLAVGGSHGDGPPPPLTPEQSELYTP
jgi:N-acetylneuraminic acid mutarotase